MKYNLYSLRGKVEYRGIRVLFWKSDLDEFEEYDGVSDNKNVSMDVISSQHRRGKSSQESRL